jgi:cell division protein FtsI (penicillin-binding protein 3)
MSGQVFHDIAEGIMAQNIKYDVKGSRDSTSILQPDVKYGNVLAADYVLSCLGFKTDGGWSGSYADGNPVWGKAIRESNKISIQRTTMAPNNQMPDVIGMGARDAVYLIESRGARVTIKGCGKVKEQSKPAGTDIIKGERITLELS